MNICVYIPGCAIARRHRPQLRIKQFRRHGMPHGAAVANVQRMAWMLGAGRDLVFGCAVFGCSVPRRLDCCINAGKEGRLGKRHNGSLPRHALSIHPSVHPSFLLFRCLRLEAQYRAQRVVEVVHHRLELLLLRGRQDGILREQGKTRHTWVPGRDTPREGEGGRGSTRGRAGGGRGVEGGPVGTACGTPASAPG